MKWIFKNTNKGVMAAAASIIAVVAVFFYLNKNYLGISGGVESIEVVLNHSENLEGSVVYINDSVNVEPNFNEAFFPKKINDTTCVVSLGREIKLRKFRFYFSDSTENVTIKAILLHCGVEKYKLDLGKFNHENLNIAGQSTTDISFSVLPDEQNSYLESQRFYYSADHIYLALATIASVMLSFLFLFLILKISLPSFSSITWAELGLMVFIISMFLPQRIFNIALIVSFLLVIRNFKLDFFLQNKVNFLFISIYILILVVNFFIYPNGSFKSIEKYTLFLALPVYVSCIRGTRSLVFFGISALLIGAMLLVFASIDISIFRNSEIISFSNFTRTIHPVYYSYLLAFCILYIELCVFIKLKYVIQTILIFLLILSSSKLIIVIVVLWFAIFVRKLISIVIVLAVVFALLLFAPMKERFGDIVNFDDLSVISEQHIDDPDDPRLNGFTLRIILWQESLCLEGAKEILFGKGLERTANEDLEARLLSRGLTKQFKFNAHNQYVTTIFKTGIVGFSLLLSVIVFCIKWSLVTNNKVLFFFTMLMCFAMLSESVFERAFGVAFFCTVILLLINSELIDRNKTHQNCVES